MKKLGYPSMLHNWVRPYYSTIFEYDKGLTTDTFCVPGTSKDLECIIFIAIDAYGMGIDNLDIKLVIQWDVPISFDTMIQRMGRAGSKGDNAIFVLLIAKWTKIEDPKEPEDWVAKRDRAARSHAHKLSDTYRPKSMHNPSPLNQAVIADDAFSDSESSIGGSNDKFD